MGDVWHTYKKIKVIGRGAFGSAILCKHKKTLSLVVIKEIFGEMTDDERTTSVSEIQVLSILRHPNIVAYFDSYIDKVDKLRGSTLLIVMEYCDGGTLE